MSSQRSGRVHEEYRTATGVVSRVRRALEEGARGNSPRTRCRDAESANALLLARRLRLLEEVVPGIEGSVELSAAAQALAERGRSDEWGVSPSQGGKRTRDVFGVGRQLEGVSPSRARLNSCGI